MTTSLKRNEFEFYYEKSTIVNSNLIIKTNHDFHFELDLFNSTRGSLQRLTPCCLRPSMKFFESTLFDSIDKINNRKLEILCSSCRESQTFESEYIPLIKDDNLEANPKIQSILEKTFQESFDTFTAIIISNAFSESIFNYFLNSKKLIHERLTNNLFEKSVEHQNFLQSITSHRNYYSW